MANDPGIRKRVVDPAELPKLPENPEVKALTKISEQLSEIREALADAEAAADRRDDALQSVLTNIKDLLVDIRDNTAE